MAVAQPLQSDQDSRAFDAAVVGNGVLGLSLGLVLARRGLRVALIGGSQRRWAASAAAGAMLGCFGEVTAAMLTSEHGRTKLGLAVRARGLWDEWLESLVPAGDDLKVAGGTVVLLNSVGAASIDDANYAAIREACALYEEPYEDIEPADVDWIDPESTSRPLRAMFLPREDAVDAGRLLGHLEAAFVAAGGVVVPELAVSLEHDSERVTGVLVESGRRLAAGDVVVAAGARSSGLLDSIPDVASRIPRLCSGVGISALLRQEAAAAPEVVLRTPNRAFACGLHLVPRGGRDVYVGATNIVGPEPLEVPVVREVVFLLNCAVRQLRRDLTMSSLRATQIGNRPVAFDGFPLVGAAGLERLWVMTGTYRDGLHLSPLLANEVARRILQEEPEVDLDLFAPVRPPIQAMSREQVVDAAVAHLVATGDENDWHVPVEWPRIMTKNLVVAYRRFADELDDLYTPPPELLAAARVHGNLLEMLRDYYAAAKAAHDVDVPAAVTASPA